MQKIKQLRAILLNIALVIFFLHSSNIYAENANARLYKVSVLVLKPSHSGPNTAQRLIDRWTDQTFLNSVDTALLQKTSSSLSGAYYTLSHSKNYTILYNDAWVVPLENDMPTTFHFHKAFDNDENTLDGLICITLKYNLEVRFQTQLAEGYKLFAIDESYQTPSNQLQYIDSPSYGALVLITRYDGS